jgi:hypothetical protein
LLTSPPGRCRSGSGFDSALPRRRPRRPRGSAHRGGRWRASSPSAPPPPPRNLPGPAAGWTMRREARCALFQPARSRTRAHMHGQAPAGAQAHPCVAYAAARERAACAARPPAPSHPPAPTARIKRALASPSAPPARASPARQRRLSPCESEGNKRVEDGQQQGETSLYLVFARVGTVTVTIAAASGCCSR